METQTVQNAKGMDMSQTTYRNKNKDKRPIDYDLNIFIPEQLDEGGDSVYDPASWCIHVYVYGDNGHDEWSEPIRLTAEEIVDLGLNRDAYFFNEVDTWYGLAGFKLDYWDKMSDRLKNYFDTLPKYYEDII
jgi:hypothetical protein